MTIFAPFGTSTIIEVTQVMQAVRFLMETGNIASGTFSLYGIKNS